MERYDPSIDPNPVEWLAFGESERVGMIERFHRDSEDELTEGSVIVHATIHMAVENQIALKANHVPGTLARLIRQGLDRHEAIHAIGAVLSEDMYEIMQGDNTTHDPGKYQRRLEKLTAKGWWKGRW